MAVEKSKRKGFSLTKNERQALKGVATELLGLSTTVSRSMDFCQIPFFWPTGVLLTNLGRLSLNWSVAVFALLSFPFLIPGKDSQGKKGKGEGEEISLAPCTL